MQSFLSIQSGEKFFAFGVPTSNVYTSICLLQTSNNLFYHRNLFLVILIYS